MRRILSLFLILVIALPGPAGATPELSRRTLRGSQSAESGAEETLVRSLARNVPSVQQAAGAEEQAHPLGKLLTQLERSQINGRSFFKQLVETIGEGDPIALEAALYGFSKFVGKPASPEPAHRESRLLGMRISDTLARAERTGAQGAEPPSLSGDSKEGGMGKGKRGPSGFSRREVDRRSKVDFNEVRRRMERMRKAEAQELTDEEVRYFFKAYRTNNLTAEQWVELSGFLKGKRFNGKEILSDFFDRHVIRRQRIGDFSGVKEAMEIIRSTRDSRNRKLTAGERETFFKALGAAEIRPDDWADLYNFLIEYNLPLVIAYLKRKGYSKRHPPSTVDDLTQIIVLKGLRNAIRKYKPEMGTQFSTYADLWFRPAAQKGLSEIFRQRHIPQHMRSEMYRYEAAGEKIAHEKGRPATPQEIARELGWDEAALRNVLEAFRLEKPISGEWDLDVQAPSDGDHPLEDLGWALTALARLDPRKRLILKMRYGLGKPNGEPSTLKEIGDRIGLSKERVRQLETKALKELRKMEGTLEAGSEPPPDDHADIFALAEMKVPFAMPIFQPLTQLGRKNLEKIWAALSAKAGMEEQRLVPEVRIAEVRGIPSRFERWTLETDKTPSADLPDGLQVYFEPGLLPAGLEEAVRGQWSGQPLSHPVLENLKARFKPAAPGRAQGLLIVNPEIADELNALSWQAPVAIVAVVPGAIGEAVTAVVFLSYLLQIVQRADDLRARVTVRIEAAGAEQQRAFFLDVAA